MTTFESGLLELQGARLYFETCGLGPVLLMIVGAAGSAEPYRAVASELASSHRVVSYDRRCTRRWGWWGARTAW